MASSLQATALDRAHKTGVPVDHPIATKIRQASATPEAAVKFFVTLLHPDPEVRCSAFQATQHPYLRSAMTTITATSALPLHLADAYAGDRLDLYDEHVFSPWTTSESETRALLAPTVGECPEVAAALGVGHVNSPLPLAACDGFAASATQQQTADAVSPVQHKAAGSRQTTEGITAGKQVLPVVNLHADCTITARALATAKHVIGSVPETSEACAHESLSGSPAGYLSEIHTTLSASRNSATASMTQPVVENNTGAVSAAAEASIAGQHPAAVLGGVRVSRSSASSSGDDDGVGALWNEHDDGVEERPRKGFSCGLRWSWKRSALVAAGVVAGVALGALAGCSRSKDKLR